MERPIAGNKVAGSANEDTSALTQPSATELELQRDKLFTSAVLDSIPGLPYLFDENGRLVRWNNKQVQMTGYSAVELSQMRLTDWFRGADVARIAAKMQEAFAEGHAEAEAKLVTKGGAAIPYYFTGVRLILDGKKYLAGIGIDISRQKAAEESLRRLSQAVEQSPVNVIITDLEGNIEYVNRKFCQLTGYTPAEVLGKNPRILKSGHTSDEEYASLWKTITAGGQWSGEFLNKAKDGSLFWERALITSIKDEAGRIEHFFAVKEDVTKSKEIDDKLHQMQLQLTHVARLSTLGEMAGKLAHELNHPLYAILNYAKACRNVLAEEGPPNLESLREWTEEIAEIATSAAEAVKRLRSFARRAESPRTACRIEEIVEEALRLVAVETRRARATSRLRSPPLRLPFRRIECRSSRYWSIF